MNLVQESDDRIVMKYDIEEDVSPTIIVPVFSRTATVSKERMFRSITNKMFRLVNVLPVEDGRYGVYWLEN